MPPKVLRGGCRPTQAETKEVCVNSEPCPQCTEELSRNGYGIQLVGHWYPCTPDQVKGGKQYSDLRIFELEFDRVRRMVHDEKFWLVFRNRLREHVPISTDAIAAMLSDYFAYLSSTSSDAAQALDQKQATVGFLLHWNAILQALDRWLQKGRKSVTRKQDFVRAQLVALDLQIALTEQVVQDWYPVVKQFAKLSWAAPAEVTQRNTAQALLLLYKEQQDKLITMYPGSEEEEKRARADITLLEPGLGEEDAEPEFGMGVDPLSRMYNVPRSSDALPPPLPKGTKPKGSCSKLPPPFEPPQVGGKALCTPALTKVSTWLKQVKGFHETRDVSVDGLMQYANAQGVKKTIKVYNLLETQRFDLQYALSLCLELLLGAKKPKLSTEPEWEGYLKIKWGWNYLKTLDAWRKKSRTKVADDPPWVERLYAELNKLPREFLYRLRDGFPTLHSLQATPQRIAAHVVHSISYKSLRHRVPFPILLLGEHHKYTSEENNKFSTQPNPAYFQVVALLLALFRENPRQVFHLFLECSELSHNFVKAVKGPLILCAFGCTLRQTSCRWLNVIPYAIDTRWRCGSDLICSALELPTLDTERQKSYNQIKARVLQSSGRTLLDVVSSEIANEKFYQEEFRRSDLQVLKSQTLKELVAQLYNVKGLPNWDWSRERPEPWNEWLNFQLAHRALYMEVYVLLHMSQTLHTGVNILVAGANHTRSLARWIETYQVGAALSAAKTGHDQTRLQDLLPFVSAVQTLPPQQGSGLFLADRKLAK